MVDNKIELDELPTVNDPISPASAPQWTTPGDYVPKSDEKNTLISNDDKDPPNYNTLPGPSAPNPDDSPPPNYFDISIVPDGTILYYNQVTLETEPSQAVVERKKDGVHSFDPLIDRNPDQLWLYFMTYLNEKPELAIKIHGYHTEYYTTYETYQLADGSRQMRPRQQTRSVTDFNFSLEASHYVSDQWWRVAVVPGEKTAQAGQFVSLRDAVEQYTRSTKHIKEITCQKQLVGWNFQEVQNHIRGIIYYSGYQGKIDVIFAMKNNEISARSSSKLSHFANSTVVRVLCVVTCLCIIFGPIYLCLRAAGSTKDHIVADYTMAATSDTFLRLNAGLIANAARSRSMEHLTANLS